LWVSLVLLFPFAAFGDPPRWVEVRSPHFVVLTNASEKSARHVAGQLERMRTLFRSILPASNDDGEAPIKVFALRDEKSFQALEPSAYLAKHQLELAGLFLRGPDSSTILLRLDGGGDHPYATVYHEYTHYMLRKADWWLPLWLNEGLAEFYQNTDIFDKDARLGQPDPNDILYLRQNRLLPLTTLLTVDHSSPYYHDENKGSVFYAESWALTHYLEIGDMQHHTNRIRDYAKYLIQHEDSVTAAQHAFGDLKKLQQDLDSYISGSNFMQVKTSIGAVEDESKYEAVPVTLTDVDAARAEVLIGTDRLPEAKALLESVLAQDAKNALAHEVMGEMKLRQGDLEDAKKWYGEAAALDPNDYLADYYFAAMCLRTGDRSHDEQVEADLQAAIKLAPRYAPAYDALAMYYAQRHEKLEEAHKLSVTAVGLEPENVYYRMNAANAFAEAGDVVNALAVLKAAIGYARTENDKALIDERILSMESYQANMERNRAMEAAEVKNAKSAAGSSEGTTVVVHMEPEGTPEHVYPADVPNAPKHTVAGVIRDVHCAYPTVLTLSVESSGKKVPLYTNNYFKVAFTTNFEVKDSVNPCKMIEGLKAKVQYAEVTSDKTVVGRVTAIELSK
jgi:tetratricopeptide (TPR) repeat protein